MATAQHTLTTPGSTAPEPPARNIGNDVSRRVLRFVGDSDSVIVRGLMSILLMLCSGRSAGEITEWDFELVFQRLELSIHLSPSRMNGLRSLARRIQELAWDLA